MRVFRYALALAAIFATSTLFAGPRLVYPPGGIDFGAIPAGEPARTGCALGNSGNAPLRVSRVTPCCGAEVELSGMEIAPGASVELTVSLKPQLPGEFSKAVRLYCDDSATPVVSIPVLGRSVEGLASGSASRFTLPAVLLAGSVDGLNPCSFAIMISLVGILAIGGRRRRARIVGGLAFCLGSFLTYVLMGLGLMQAIRALEGLRTVRTILMVALSLALFLLSILSLRDAVRFRRTPVFSVVTLRLPEGVRALIRRIAMESWNGSAVVAAGLGCGFLVTLLDALCTGQVYVPVLALIAHEPGAWRSFAFLIAYNLAFIAPLVAVFVLFSGTTDAFRMARWSSRNVIPSKIALGVVFALLGIFMLLIR